MKTIPLTRGKEAIVDDEDYEELSRHKWHCLAIGYAARSKKYRGCRSMIYMHRQVTGAASDQIVDHRDRNKLNNKKANLRFASPTESLQNTGFRNASSGLKGAHAKGGKFRASISHNGKLIHLGTFETAAEAHSVYCIEASLRFGQFANHG